MIIVDLEEIQQAIDGLRQLEAELATNKIQVQPNTKEFSHHKFFGGTDASRKEATGAVKALLGFNSYAKR